MGEKNTTYGWSPDLSVSLLAKLKEDLKTAMRSKDSEVRDAIRQVMSEFPKLTVPITLESGKKSTRGKREDEMTDDDILGIIQGLIKSEKIMLEAQKTSSSVYLETLSSYLPQSASNEEIASWIRENIDFSSLKSPMQAVGMVMKHFGKSADGGEVKRIVQEIAGD